MTMHRLLRRGGRGWLSGGGGRGWLNVEQRVLCAPRRENAALAVTPPTHSRVVICGGGVIGCSIAYHLSLMGWKDVVLLEKGQLTCGTTWHSGGLVGTVRTGAVATALCAYSARLYAELERDGYFTGWKQCGSLNLARCDDRMIAFKRDLPAAARLGIETELLSPIQIRDRLPMLRTDDLQGGIWVPGDGVVDATQLTQALARKAKEAGVQVIENCSVTRVSTEDGKVSRVDTNIGNIKCEVFVNCAGIWAWQVGQLCEPPVRVPLHACEHFYLISKPIESVDTNMPVVRDYDGHIYLREWGGGLMGGGFEPVAKPIFHHGIPDKFHFQLLPDDWDHFQVLLEELLHRVPELENATVAQQVNGPESFTPDGRLLLGHAPEVENYFVAAGMNSRGVAMAGGVGRAMAEWVVNGETAGELWPFDVRRFTDLHNNRKFLRDRVKETLGKTVEVVHWDRDLVGNATGRCRRMSAIYPRMQSYDAEFGVSMGFERPVYFRGRLGDLDPDVPTAMSAVNFAPAARSTRRVRGGSEYTSCRKLRSSPLFARLEDSGATFQQLLGYERAVHFVKPEDFIDDVFDAGDHGRSAFGKPAWFERVRAEYWACREGVCLIDMSTFTKFELSSVGSEVVDFLQYVCSNDVDRPVGTVIHTGMQNHSGGYENDCSVVRLAPNKYFMIGPTAQQTRSFAWLQRHLPRSGRTVQLSDVTSMYTAINVIGPKAQELLAELTDTPLDTHNFPSMTCKELDVGQASQIKAMRLTHTGEDGWMLYVPSEYALHVYDSLMFVGKSYGICNAGYYALRALRTERFFAYWGTDLTPHVTPLECGREYRVKFNVGGFIGCPALLDQRGRGVRQRLVQLIIEDHDVNSDLWPWGGEPIYRDGVFCGTVTSTAFGFTLDRHVGMGYVRDLDPATGEARLVTPEFLMRPGVKYEVDIAGRRFPAKVAIYPPNLRSAAVVIDGA